jgi:aspartyl/asparaginyl-tRNA synthetase
MTYREALTALNRRGWSMPFGEDFHRDAEATLVRYCGNLPVHVTHLPVSLELFNVKLADDDPQTAECVDYVLPFAGETCSGAVYETDPEQLGRRIRQSAAYGHLMRRAREFARARVAAAERDEKTEDYDALVTRYQRGIADAFSAYVALFRKRRAARGGCAIGVARLLQCCMGLDSVQDAVVFPLDRATFADRGAEGESLGSAAGIA